MNSKTMYYYQLIPEKIYENLDVIVTMIKPVINGFSSDCLKEIISIIACHVQKSDACAPLKIEYLKKLVPQGDKYLHGLIDNRIILREGKFIPGKIAYKYRFSPQYNSKYLTFPLKNPKLSLRIRKVFEQFRRENSKSVRGRSEQVEFLKNLCIDDSYTKYLKSLKTPEQFNNALASATRILNKDIFYSIDSTSGRFHSNITNLAKGLRTYITINDEHLVNIDIRNSQPYLSTIILTNPGKVSWMTETNDFALLLQSLKVSLNEDVKKYISLVISGQLYEYLMTDFYREGLKLSRDEVKVQVLRILFARNRTPKDEVNKKCRKIFRNIFPTVHRIFSIVRGSVRGDKFTSYKRFAILLQRIESYLILDIIIKRIYRELPGVIAVTVHDSIMTGVLTDKVDEVKKIMVEEFRNFIGFAPILKIEGRCSKEERKEEKGGRIKQYDATTFVTNNISIN